MDQAEVFHFGSIWGAIVCLASYVAIALVIGVGSGRAIAAGFKSVATGRVVGGVCGMVLVSGLLTTFHFATLDGFYRLEMRGEEVTVQWMFPPRSQRVLRADIARVGVAGATHGQQRLVLELNDGSRLSSARDASPQITLARPALAPPVARSDDR